MPKTVKFQTLIVTVAAVIFLGMAGVSYLFFINLGSNKEGAIEGNFRFSKSRPLQAELVPAAKLNELSSSMDRSEQVLPKVGLKIIKTGSLYYKVKDYQKSRTAIVKVVKEYQAYLVSENEENTDNDIRNTMSIRVPAERFDLLVDSLLKESIKLENKNITATDVTAEFIDTAARLKAKKAVEERYLAILKRAQSVKDILEVEGQLGSIREEIEATEGRLKYLNDQVMYSTISLTFYQTIKRLPEPESGFWYKTGSAFVKGWNALLSFLTAVVYIWPFLIIAAGLIFSYWKFRKKPKK